MSKFTKRLKKASKRSKIKARKAKVSTKKFGRNRLAEGKKFRQSLKERTKKSWRWATKKSPSKSRTKRFFARVGSIIKVPLVAAYTVVVAVGMTVLAIASLVAMLASFLMSQVSRLAFYIGVAFAVVGILLSLPFTAVAVDKPAKDKAVATKTDKVKANDVKPQRPTIEAVDAPVSESTGGEQHLWSELQYHSRMDSGDLPQASYWYGYWQAEAAKAAGENKNKAWAMLNKQIQSSVSDLHLRKVREGWAEVWDTSRVGVS